MKKIATCLLLLSSGVFSFTLSAQNVPSILLENGGEYPGEHPDANNPCITAQQYALIETQCAENRILLGIPNTAGPESAMTTTLSWPLKSANGLNDCNYYGISAYVDQNINTGATTDYNCGSKTYDGHRGTDISIWPFPFYKMDNNQVEVVAAAPGMIINKVDGNFDKNCGSNALTANYIVIQHADGSVAIYYHMKKNSLTPKIVGQAVIAGEYLGIVGHSGNSSGPHLHFEVWSGSTVSTRIDPYAGACNSLNATSWWAAQKPYAAAEILKTSVHTTDAVLPACPATETPNETGCFALPFQGPGLPPGSAKFYIFMRYETAGLSANLSILNPDGSTFTNWTYNSTTNYSASYRNWTKTLPTIPGTYTFQSSYNGISCSKTFDIISGAITPSGPTTFCLGGSVTLSAGAGSSYLWSTGATTQSINVTSSGNYSVTVSSASGCSAASTATSVTVNPLPNAGITPSGPTAFCQGGSVTLSAPAGNTYLWSTGATAQSINVSSSGNYTVTVTNASGCSAASSATAVTVNPLPNAGITPSGPTTFCQGGSVTLSAPVGNTYVWSTGATAQSINVLSSGNYAVTVTNASGCSAVSAAAAVTVNPLPNAGITPSGPTIFCQGGSVTLSAPAGNTYLWSTGATFQSINVSFSGNYAVTVTNASGCSAASTATAVTVNPMPNAGITPSGPTTFCQGGSVTLSAPAGNTYLWSSGATAQSINVSSSGNYAVTVTNASGCSAASSATAVTVNPLPNAGITPSGPTTFCQGGFVTLSAPAGNTYLWSSGATSQSINVSSSGNYAVTVTNASGCSAASTTTAVTVNPLPIAGITPSGPTTFCQGGSVTLSAPAGNTYLWSTGPTSQSINVSFSGNYGVTVTNASGCSAASAATAVTVNPLPNACITPSGPTTFCQGGSVMLSAAVGNTYLWSSGATTQSINISSSGNYAVTVTNASNCSAASAATAVTVNPLPPLPSIAANGALLRPSSATGNQWYLNGNSISGATAQTYTAPQNGNYTVQVTDGNGCTILSAVFNFISTGIDIISENNTAAIIPNPNNGIFIIEMGNAQTPKSVIEIYNLLGVKILISDLQFAISEIDISTQPNGIYFAVIKSPVGKQIIKILKV